MTNGKRYIYNWEQAYYFMVKGGVEPIEKPQVHFQSGKIFFVFDYDKTREINDKWIHKKE